MDEDGKLISRSGKPIKASVLDDEQFNEFGLVHLISTGLRGPVDPFTQTEPSANLYQRSPSSIINRNGEVVIPFAHNVRPFDHNGLAWITAEESNASSSYGIAPFVVGLMDTKGETIVTLDGSSWLPLRELDVDMVAWPLESVTLPNHYVVYKDVSDLEQSWVSRYWAKLQGWLGDEPERTKIVCRCFDKQGTLIWSSAWIRYETMCLIVLTSALLLAFVVRPKRKKQVDAVL